MKREVTDKMVESGLRGWLGWSETAPVSGHSQLPRMRTALETAMADDGTRPNRRNGALARAASLSPGRRHEIAVKANAARWDKNRSK